jgi:hypothetical protein
MAIMRLRVKDGYDGIAGRGCRVTHPVVASLTRTPPRMGIVWVHTGCHPHLLTTGVQNMRTVLISLVTLILVAGTAAAQSPVASPLASTAPGASPVASPLVSPAITPVPGPALTFKASNRKACPSGLTCAWYLTVIDATSGTAFTTPLIPGSGKDLVATPPLPATLDPGTWLVEASEWVQTDPSATEPPANPKHRRTASCAQIISFLPSPSLERVELSVVFRKNKTCTMDYSIVEADF